jgi:hypothetical protein
MNELEREAAAFEANVAEWRRTDLGRFVVIHDEEIAGFYDSLSEAFAEGTRRYGLDPFLVRQVLPENPVNVSLLGAHLLAH